MPARQHAAVHCSPAVGGPTGPPSGRQGGVSRQASHGCVAPTTIQPKPASFTRQQAAHMRKAAAGQLAGMPSIATRRRLALAGWFWRAGLACAAADSETGHSRQLANFTRCVAAAEWAGWVVSPAGAGGVAVAVPRAQPCSTPGHSGCGTAPQPSCCLTNGQAAAPGCVSTLASAEHQ